MNLIRFLFFYFRGLLKKSDEVKLPKKHEEKKNKDNSSSNGGQKEHSLNKDVSLNLILALYNKPKISIYAQISITSSLFVIRSCTVLEKK